jgi:hypothetical protein
VPAAPQDGTGGADEPLKLQTAGVPQPSIAAIAASASVTRTLGSLAAERYQPDGRAQTQSRRRAAGAARGFSDKADAKAVCGGHKAHASETTRRANAKDRLRLHAA